MNKLDWLILIGAVVIMAVLAITLSPSPAEAAICVEDGQMQLSWQANPEPDVSHYDVYESVTVDGTYNKIATVTGTGHTAIGLVEGNHYFKLKAVDQCGLESLFSDASELVRIDTTPPGKPGVVVITVVAE